MVLVNHAMHQQAQDVLVLLLEIFVGLASFTGCLVAVDKLYLFYATVFYKGMALLRPQDWEPTLRAFFKQYAPAKTGEVRLCTSRRPPSGMTLRPPFSPSRRCPCTSSTGRGARRR